VDLKTLSVKGVAWSFVETVAARFIAFGIVAVLGRLLEPKDFGLVALALVFTAFMELWISQGVGDFIVQRQYLEDEHLDTAFWTNLSVGVGLSLVLMAAADPIARFNDAPELAVVIRLLSLSLIATAMTPVQVGLLQRDFQFRSLAARSVVAAVAGGITGVSTAVAGFGAMALVAQILVARFASAALLWAAADWRPRFRFSRTHFAELWEFGGKVYGAALIRFAGQKADRLLIGKFVGLSSLGSYYVAQRVLELLARLLNKSSDKVALNVFSRLQEDPAARQKGFLDAVELAAFVSFPVFIGASAMAGPLLATVFGPKWNEAVPVLRVLALAGIVYTPNYLISAMLTSTARTETLVIFHSVLTTVRVVGLLLAVPYGLLAISIVWVTALLAVHPVELALARSYAGLDIPAYFRRLAGPLLSAIITGALVVALEHSMGAAAPPLKLAVGTSAGATSYLFLMVLVKRSLVLRFFALARSAF
jgi:PST family polysaccharide transporter